MWNSESQKPREQWDDATRNMTDEQRKRVLKFLEKDGKTLPRRSSVQKKQRT